MAKAGSTTTACRVLSSATRYDAQPRASSTNCVKITAIRPYHRPPLLLLKCAAAATESDQPDAGRRTEGQYSDDRPGQLLRGLVVSRYDGHRNRPGQAPAARIQLLRLELGRPDRRRGSDGEHDLEPGAGVGCERPAGPRGGLLVDDRLPPRFPRRPARCPCLSEPKPTVLSWAGRDRCGRSGSTSACRRRREARASRRCATEAEVADARVLARQTLITSAKSHGSMMPGQSAVRASSYRPSRRAMTMR